jgi:conjugative relaxase-like TrwC/TraI family protein
MFTAIAQKNLADAEMYFDQHLAQNDYYSVGEIHPGQWIGLGAVRLGLQNAVTREQFRALCENRNPADNERLTQRLQREGQRRVFYDFTCSAPKSVSVLAVTLDDSRLLQAHEQAAKLAFGELESFAAARVRKQGRQKDRTTGNLVAAAFVHDSSRALDPQLHTHFTVFNATFDEREQCWKALQARPMYEAIRYGTAVYRNELAKRIQQLGYRLRPAEHGFEIEGVSEAVLRRFSKRAQARDQAVKEMEQKLGRKLSNDAVALAVHQSRARKLTGISTADVRSRQLAQLVPEECQALQQLCASAHPMSLPRIALVEQTALNYAVAHLFERQSVVPEHELLNAALSHRLGAVDLRVLKRTLKHSADLVKTEGGLSTRQILAMELDLIQSVNEGCGAVPPLHPGYHPAESLGEDQRRAIYHLLRTGDRITGLRGLAGSGKTSTLRELAAACNQARVEPLFCAPTAAATDVLRKEGFNALTLQSLVMSKPALSERHLVVVDEAGAVGLEDMKRLFDLGRTCRVILCGDTGQHASVARGDALRILEHHSRLQSGQLTVIRRQHQAQYRQAVELAAGKKTAQAFALLERMGAIRELSNDKVHDAAARAYVKAMAQGRAALLIAPTWNEIEAVTQKVREELDSAGRLAGEEKEFEVFDSLSWTAAQKADSEQYRPGLALRFHRRAGGFTKDESVEVLAVEIDSLKVRRADGSEGLLRLARTSTSYDVGEKRKLKVAAGERLLLQSNRAKRFISGELVEIKALAGEAIVLRDGRTLPHDYRTFTHGYAVTSHAAQGKTADEVLVVASTRSLPAVSQEQFYVSISRGRELCRVFTDDAERLRAHVTRSSARPAAIEGVPAIGRRPFLQAIMQRGHRFLQRLRQRIAREASLSPDRSIPSFQTSFYEEQRRQRKSIHRISV